MEIDIAPWVTNKRSQCHVGIDSLKNILMMNLIELNSIRKIYKVVTMLPLYPSEIPCRCSIRSYTVLFQVCRILTLWLNPRIYFS